MVSAIIPIPARASNSVAVYFGPASPTPLVEMLRLRRFEIEPFYLLTAAYNHGLWTDGRLVAFEAEGQLTKHFERWNLFSTNAALMFRWLKMPWDSAIDGSFAFGSGISYASGTLDVEAKHLEKTSRFLNYLVMELTFAIGKESPWESLIRIHHRSGVFGLYGDVVGGSDYLCVGLRYRL